MEISQASRWQCDGSTDHFKAYLYYAHYCSIDSRVFWKFNLTTHLEIGQKLANDTICLAFTTFTVASYVIYYVSYVSYAFQDCYELW